MIRIYGHSHGNASFAQVTRGVERAARAVGVCGGVVPVDLHYRDDVDYPGATAPVSVNCGAPSGVQLAHSMGLHKRRWLLFAPNSARVHPAFAKSVRELLDGLLVPSTWAVDVVREALPGFPVELCQHGVFPEYKRAAGTREEITADYLQREKFDVLHMTSSASDRKGTRALLEAWRLIRARRKLPEGAHLYIVSMGHVTMHARQWMAESASDGVTLVDGGHGSDPSTVSELYYASAHVVCQPSRVEGFGLCPIEALACGVPVVATFCTGHFDTLAGAAGGVVRVTHGPDAPSADSPGAMAPSVDPEAIAEALVAAYLGWRKLEADAAAQAAAVQKSWSWEKRTGPVLRWLVEEAT